MTIEAINNLKSEDLALKVKGKTYGEFYSTSINAGVENGKKQYYSLWRNFTFEVSDNKAKDFEVYADEIIRRSTKPDFLSKLCEEYNISGADTYSEFKEQALQQGHRVKEDITITAYLEGENSRVLYTTDDIKTLLSEYNIYVDDKFYVLFDIPFTDSEKKMSAIVCQDKINDLYGERERLSNKVFAEHETKGEYYEKI